MRDGHRSGRRRHRRRGELSRSGCQTHVVMVVVVRDGHMVQVVHRGTLQPTRRRHCRGSLRRRCGAGGGGSGRGGAVVHERRGRAGGCACVAVGVCRRRSVTRCARGLCGGSGSSVLLFCPSLHAQRSWNVHRASRLLLWLLHVLRRGGRDGALRCHRSDGGHASRVAVAALPVALCSIAVVHHQLRLLERRLLGWLLL